MDQPSSPLLHPFSEYAPETILEVIADNSVDAATHASLDAQVLTLTRAAPSSPRHFELACLLSAIATYSGGRVDPRYVNNTVANQLLEDQPQLGEKLQEAWRAGQFEQIRNLSTSSVLMNTKQPLTLIQRFFVSIPSTETWRWGFQPKAVS
jgi:hypothetical protein